MMRAAKKDASVWLDREVATIRPGEKLKHKEEIKRAIKELSSIQMLQMDLL